MAVSERVASRLYNWKFESAQQYVAEECDAGEGEYTENEDALITALAETFGNCGHFLGRMSEIIRAAVSTLIPGTPDE